MRLALSATQHSDGGTKPRWYHSSAPPTLVTVPTHVVLHARFSMAQAVLPERPSTQQRQAFALGAVVLDEEDHDVGMAELERRAE